MRSSYVNDERWIAEIHSTERVDVRLFCLPYAGGNATIFYDWPAHLSDGIAVCPIMLPGRGMRIEEPPYTRMSPLVRAIADALQPYLEEPIALFGHSMGALVSFEVARELRRRHGILPARLFVAAHHAPSISRSVQPIHALPDDELIRKLRALNGAPQEAFDNPELMELMLPTVRADFEVCEAHSVADEPALATPISAFAGMDDTTMPADDMRPWREQTNAEFTLRVLPGDHFFLHSAQDLLLRAIAADLTELLDGDTPAPRRAAGDTLK